MKSILHLHTYWRPTVIRPGMLVLALFVFAVTAAAQGQPAEPSVQGDGNLKVMTYNMYVGTSYAGVTSPSFPDFLQAMTNTVLDIRASDPPGRAQALASQIAATRPHLVSLQEVASLSTGITKTSLAVEFDCLQLLLDALVARGVPYTPVFTLVTWDATAPSTMGYVRGTWRIVILVRTDVVSKHLSLANVQGGLFLTTISYRLPALEGAYAEFCPVSLTGSQCLMPWPRGWASADVSYRGKQFRYINATLESNSNSRNIAQGLELLSGPINTSLPVVLAGDLNCDLSNLNDPKRLTCVRFIGAGFVDAWSAANPSDPGFTKHLPAMTMRSDYVMLRDLFVAGGSALLGEDPADKTASGLWPSNHAGVIAKLDRPE